MRGNTRFRRETMSTLTRRSVLAGARATAASSLSTVGNKSLVLAAAPQMGHDELVRTLNQNTVTIISGNPNGTYLYLAYEMSAVIHEGNELRVLPVIVKGVYRKL